MSTLTRIVAAERPGWAIFFVGDSNGDPVRNVVVTATFTGAFSETASAVTNRKGRAVVKTSMRIDGLEPFTVCVGSLEKVDFGYDPAGNAQTCASTR